MKIIQVMNIYDDGEVNTIGGRVYDPKGIMRTLGGGSCNESASHHSSGGSKWTK